MNKMIQRQDIVPPWIEKQQELVKAANVFRARLRTDWRRHAARTISSRGGSLQDQMQIADRYAESERVHNPKIRKVEEISVPTNATSDPVMVKISQEAPSTTSPVAPPVKISVETKDGEIPVLKATIPQTIDASPDTPMPLPAPFRVATWEAAEQSYLKLAIKNLNDITRSYNLMAPDLAKKPYFSLERELRSCYADVAPQLAEEIRQRAARPPAKDLVMKSDHAPGSVMERFVANKAVIYESKRPLYGFKEFWRDLFGEKRA